MIVDYFIQIVPVFKNYTEGHYTVPVFETEATDNKEIISNKVLEEYKDKLTKADNYIVVDIKPSYIALENNKEYTKEYEESKLKWTQYYNSKEYKTLQLKYSYDNILHQIKQIQKQVEELELLDSQDFLNFQDSLNKLSLDPDRK